MAKREGTRTVDTNLWVRGIDAVIGRRSGAKRAVVLSVLCADSADDGGSADRIAISEGGGDAHLCGPDDVDLLTPHDVDDDHADSDRDPVPGPDGPQT